MTEQALSVVATGTEEAGTGVELCSNYLGSELCRGQRVVIFIFLAWPQSWPLYGSFHIFIYLLKGLPIEPFNNSNSTSLVARNYKTTLTP